MLNKNENFIINDVQTDNLGRAVIDDSDLLDLINGSIQLDPVFMAPDVGCGNSNCLC